jgi:hypothetical protein
MTLSAALALAGFLLAAPSARADDLSPNVMDENTALTVGAQRVKVGVLSLDYGVTERLAVGTDPPAWALRSVSQVFVPNLHFKGVIVEAPQALLTARIAGYYADISTDTASGHLLTIPLSLFASAGLGKRTWIHIEGNYNWVRGFGAGDLNRADLQGALVARTAQLGAMLEVRLTRVLALLARARYQVYSSPLVLQGTGTIDPYTTVEVAASLQPAHPHPAMAVAAAAFTWRHVGLVAGAGYGHYFVPGANLALSYRGLIPEGSLWVVF